MDDGAWMHLSPTPPPPAKEPMFRAPWPVLALVGSMLALYALQQLAPDQVGLTAALGFSPAELERGRMSGLLTALFVHGGWGHVLLNAAAALAFGAPVARLFGPRRRGVLAFFVFYLACGTLASLGYAAVHAGGRDVLIGASGAVSGLMGAASRLIERRAGLAPFSSLTVIAMAIGWITVNTLVALLGAGFGAGSAPVAWEAHLAGYAAGLLLVAPTARLLGRLRRA